MGILTAIAFGTQAHGEQKRKYTLEPYINHPIAVATRLEKMGFHGDILLAAILHDVVEDTTTTIEEIQDAFGDNVAKIVTELTDVYTSAKYPDLNRRERKRREVERLATISAEAQSIKLSDIIDNLPSIMEHDPGFGQVYLQEKIQIVAVLTQGLPELQTLAKQLIQKYQK